MILDKALLIKGLGGLTACAAVACTGTYIARPDLFKSNEKELVDLISKVGLTGCTNANKECTIKTEGISVKQGENKEKSKTKQTGSTGKIKVYKEASSDNYNKGFRFVIEDGDITLTNASTGTSSPTITKLEQFETYEIKKEDSGNDWYLTRKFTKSEAIKNALGLPDEDNNCVLPTETTANKTCTLDASKLKAINFEGKSTSQNPTIPEGVSATLTISKETTDTDIFTNGYKFSLQATGGTGNVTIPVTSETITIPANKSVEFKIKKSGSSLTLEKAWTLDKLLDKVGLSGCKTTSSDCTIKDTGLNLQQDSDKVENKTKQNASSGTEGKIKLSSSNDTDYEHGFKFVIEDGNISLADSKTLEQFETYEIKNEGTGSNKKWYLTRKTKAIDEKKKLLGLPPSDTNCVLPSTGTATCSEINATKLKAINFKDKDSDGASIVSGGTVTLTITKISDSPFNDEGYKFSFNPTQDVTISTSSSIKIKKGTNTEFKITKEGNSLSLEKAWTITTLAQKVGLTNCDTTAKTCDLPTAEPSLKLYNGSNDNEKTENGQVSDNSQKIKYEENAADHNQGFKFFTESEITLANGNSGKKIEASTAATYEIVKNTTDSKWYLTKKAVTNGATG